jgi:hypothetical protein
MTSTTPFLQKTFALGALTVISTGAVLVAPAAQAATYYDLDFNYSGLVKNGDTSNAGTFLNAHDLDGAGQNLGGTLYSTTLGNIGDIWKAEGITITGDPANNRTDPLGLFNSNCTPGHAGNNNFDASRCEQRINRSTYGDNDLATGTGSYRHNGTTINYDTAEQGNLLIFEENEGNAAPDDAGPGGIFYFDIAEEKNWTLEKIGFVDDARGNVTYTYRDGSSDTDSFDIPGENELRFFTGDQSKEIAQVAVRFNSSGGISGLRFKEIEAVVPNIPEPAAGVGLVVFGAVAARLKRKPVAIA